MTHLLLSIIIYYLFVVFINNNKKNNRNLGATFVDDFVCDCCDGSDEAKGHCANTCDVEGATWRAEVQARLESFERGVAKRREYVEKAELEFGKARAELAQKRTELQSAEEFVKSTSAARDLWSVRERLANKLLDERKKAANPADAVPASPPADAAAATATPPASEEGDDDDEDVIEDAVAAEPTPATATATPVEDLKDEMVYIYIYRFLRKSSSDIY